ncbi:4-alpha-glucanotransferase [Agathobacter rectalis]|nr:4-alpha-glucanotransferase [Agathobacter rectalis]MDB8008634.1 4-alpha-glucanotransferase [Agathobacter rectalis]MDB8011067.1 4-alpha-glucanotransferase [Agathobacter rectalis]
MLKYRLTQPNTEYTTKGRKNNMRTSGVLMPISSLPSQYGIGTMGKEAKRFVDFLEKGGQTYWQILPICPTSYGDSPYQSFSSFAGNPYFIDLELLCKDKLLTKKECESYKWGKKPQYVDYGIMYVNRYALLRKAYERFSKKTPADYEAFCSKEAEWLDEYTLFMALKDANGGVAWSEWDDALKFRKPEAIEEAKEKYADDIAFYKMLQYLFFKQWTALKAYANEKGIRIIGDVPIYVAMDSADVWANPTQFYLDKDLNPIEVAGCPPDAFSADGQLWGNPLFRWDVMKKDSYSWWTKRISAMAKLYDIVRIDHFRGFDSFYAIPAKDDTAKNGVWKDGPGMDLFNVLEKKLGKLPIIVEDLGFLTPSVKKLLKDSGFPGMKVIQFAFDSREDSDYLPHNYPQHCVVYTGTHDNDTVMGWMKTAPKDCVRFAKDYLNLTKEEGYNWGMMRAAWSSVADMAIVPMQDLLGLDSKARLNIPSTTGGNWQWRATPEQIDNKLAKKLHKCMQMYARLREEPKEASDKSDAKETADASTCKTAGCEKKAAK